MKEKTTFFKSIKNNITRWDMIAIGVFLFLIAWYAYAVQTGMGNTDESFYNTVTMRMLQGDKLFVDEWYISQLFSVLLYIPYRIFMFFSGSHDGIILAMRIFTIVVTLPVYWFIYHKLKKYKLFAIIISYLFCVCFPGGLISLNYMVVPVYSMMIACLILFTAKKPLSMWKLIIVGLVISCAVLEQPMLVVMYLMFSVFCLIRAKKSNFLKNYDFFINTKTWIGITIGCAIAFIIVVGGIILKSGLSDIIKTVPELFTDSEYDFSIGGGHAQRFFYKIYDASRLYGIVFTCASVVVSILAALRKRFAPWHQKTLKMVFFILACLLLTAQIIHAIITIHIYSTQPNAYGYDAPTYAVFLLYGAYFSFASTIFGLTCYLLCDKKNPRVFVFWITGTIMSLLETYGAQVTMSLGGPISNVTTFICLKQLWDEGILMQIPVQKMRRKTRFTLKQDKLQHSLGKALCISLSIALCALVVWGSANLYPEGIRPYVETIASSFPDKKISQRFTAGPYKGIRTSVPIKRIYDDILEDLDEISKDIDGEPFYVAGIAPFYYLYLNSPVGSYSAWYVESDSETRQLRYWELHPERYPKYYYIPLYPDGLCLTNTWEEEKARMDKKVAFLKRISECSVKKGKAGYIVKITSWKDKKA